MTTETTTIDLNASYRVQGYGGIAFYLLGYATTWTEGTWTYLGEPDDYDPDTYYDLTGYYYPDEDPDNYAYNEPEEIEDRQFVRAVMVGDDHVHIVDADDLEPLAREEYCGQCGQIGCTHDGYDREEN